MKKVIILAIIYLTLFAIGMNLEAQPRIERTFKFTKLEQNNNELKGFIYGTFAELNAITGGNGKTKKENQEQWLRDNADIGFLFSSTREFDIASAEGFAPMGSLVTLKHVDESNIDTLIFVTTLSNVPLNTYFSYRPYYSPKSSTGTAYLDGTEEVNKKVKDVSCTPFIDGIEIDKIIPINRLDTFTVSVDGRVFDWCTADSDTIKYKWEFALANQVIDTLNNEVTTYDTTYVNEEFRNWSENKTGTVVYNRTTLKAEVRAKSWDKMLIRMRYFNNAGETYSEAVRLNVIQ